MNVRLVSTAPVPPALQEHLRRLGLGTAAAEADVAVATDWRAVTELFEVPASRHALYVQELAHLDMAADDPFRLAAALVYNLPLDFLVQREEVAAELLELRPEARIEVVPPGADPIDGDPPAHDGPLRVLVAAGAGDVPAAMAEPHAVVAGEADVLVDLSPSPAVLDAHAAGCATVTAVALAPTEHRRTGLVADPGDVAGAARLLDELARDRGLLAELRAGALASARAWPDRAQAARRFGDVLERLVAEEPPAELRWPSRLLGDAVAHATQLRAVQEGQRAELHALRTASPLPASVERAQQAAKRLRSVARRVRAGR